MMEHDAAIAAQAREDETNRIISILEGYRFGLDYPDCPPGDTIKSLVESLRSSSEAREDVLTPLRRAYGKFKCQDILLSEVGCKCGDVRTATMTEVAGELWISIKESLRSEVRK